MIWWPGSRRKAAVGGRKGRAGGLFRRRRLALREFGPQLREEGDRIDAQDTGDVVELQQVDAALTPLDPRHVRIGLAEPVRQLAL
jgi:hypothetical protein